MKLQGKQERWRSDYGQAIYPCRDELDRLLQDYKGKDLLRGNLLDLGSGVFSPTNYVPPVSKVVQVDFAHPSQSKGLGILRLPFDIETFDLAQEVTQGAVKLVLEFLDIQVPCHEPPFDTVVFQNVLNYVDAPRVMDQYLQFLKPHGLCIVGNSPFFGYPELFSAHRFITNRAMQDYLASRGHTIVEENFFGQGVIPPFLLSVTRKPL